VGDLGTSLAFILRSKVDLIQCSCTFVCDLPMCLQRNKEEQFIWAQQDDIVEISVELNNCSYAMSEILMMQKVKVWIGSWRKFR
jgi:hypothetical protein